jgi:transcriptional antiterminator NusG
MSESVSSRPAPTFEKGEHVKIIEGPFAGFTGIVDEVHTDLNTLKIFVTLFGRSTPIRSTFGKSKRDRFL